MRVSGTPLSPVETFEAALEDAAARITLRVSDKMAQFLSSSRVGTNGADWSQQLTLMNDAVYEELGLPHRLAEIVIDETVPFPGLRPQINDVRCPVVRGLDPDEFLVNDTVERLRLLNVEGRRATNPANENEAAIIHGRKVAEICEQTGLTVLDTGGFALQVLRSRIRRHAGSLMPLSMADLAFRRLSIEFPATARRAEEVFTLIDRTRILRCLLREGISIRNLLQISEALVLLGPPLDIDFSKLIVFNFPGIDAARPPLASEVQSLADGVRMALKRQVTYFYTRRTSTLVVHLLDPEIEAGFMSGAAPSFVEAFRRSVWSELNDRAWGVPPKVILTSATIRAQCAESIAADLPDVAVVSYSELAPDINIEPIGRIELD
jgi:type III secretion protein V